jgi:thioredoxin 2
MAEAHPVAAPVVTCPNCGTRNRIKTQAEGVPRCANCQHALPWIVDATKDTFGQEVVASVPVLVDFWAPWCGPCRMVTPAVERLATERAGKLKVVKLNVDDAPQIAGRFGVQGIPLLVLLRNAEEVARQVGAVPYESLRAWLEPYIETAAPKPG